MLHKNDVIRLSADNESRIFTVTHANSENFWVNDVKFYQKAPHYRGPKPTIKVTFVKQDMNLPLFQRYGKFVELVDIRWQSVGSGTITLTAEKWDKFSNPIDLAKSLIEAQGLTGVDVRIMNTFGQDRTYLFRGAVK